MFQPNTLLKLCIEVSAKLLVSLEEYPFEVDFYNKYGIADALVPLIKDSMEEFLPRSADFYIVYEWTLIPDFVIRNNLMNVLYFTGGTYDQRLELAQKITVISMCNIHLKQYGEVLVSIENYSYLDLEDIGRPSHWWVNKIYNTLTSMNADCIILDDLKKREASNYVMWKFIHLEL